MARRNPKQSTRRNTGGTPPAAPPPPAPPAYNPPAPIDFNAPATYSGTPAPPPRGVAEGGGVPNFRGGANGTDIPAFTLPSWTNVMQHYQPPKVNLPLTGYGQASLNSIEDSLASNLAGYGAQYSQIAPQYNLQNARIQTNEGQDRAHLAETLADRGIFNSGVTNTDFTNLAGQYNRNYQDLISSTEQQAANTTSGISGTVGDYYNALADLYNQIAATEYQNQNSPVPTHDGSGGQQGGGGSGGGGNGGGGGNSGGNGKGGKGGKTKSGRRNRT